VQGLFRRAYGVKLGLVIASLLFGVVHYVALAGTGSRLVYIVVAGILGLVLGALYEKTQNLIVPIIVHGAYNTVIFYTAYVAATGGIEMPNML
jgi:membrane protease YdiL (CAAX protease family)